MFKRVLIANRGVIASRIQKACKKLGIETIAIYTPGDENSLHVTDADKKICISSYKDVPEIIAVAQHFMADAIHPGAGFLSENSRFVEVVGYYDNMTFIGPSKDIVELMGDKVRARQIAEDARIPVSPGSKTPIVSEKTAIAFAEQIGYPLMVKASAGGGGMGLERAYNESELIRAYRKVQSFAKQAFGNDAVFIERYIEDKRHIEVQILGDNCGRVVHLGERDCTIQRRNQKLVEFSPASIDSKVRSDLLSSAVRLAESIGYSNAGTVEYLFDEHGNFYFMEVNARVQVEHRVSELMTGIDLVAEQLRIASGERLGYVQRDIVPKGFALECRINAEDPDRDFEGCPGIITQYIPPEEREGELIVDTYIPVIKDNGNFQLSVSYDSLIANLITHGDTKKGAVERMKAALLNFVIEGEGVKTTIPYHLSKIEEF